MYFLAAVDGPTVDDKISKRFGFAAFHLVIDSESFEIVKQFESNHDMPSHGLDRFIGTKIDGVISGNVGPSAFQDINGRNLPVYIIRSATAKEAIQKILDGEVEPATAPSMKHSVNHPSHDHNYGHGGGHSKGQGYGQGHGQGRGQGGGHGHRR